MVHECDDWRGITPSPHSANSNPEPPIFASKFSKTNNYKHILAIANEDGKIAIQDTTKVNENTFGSCSLEGEQCHNNAVFDLEWVPNQMKLVSASGDYTAQLWELTESKLVQSRIFSGHTRSVKTAAFRKTDSSVFATGGRDGAILIWDIRAKMNEKAENRIYSGHAGGCAPATPQSVRRRFRSATPNSTKLPPNVASSSITGLAFQVSWNNDHTYLKKNNFTKNVLSG
jgi:denticleless